MKHLIYLLFLSTLLMVQACSPRYAEFDSYEKLWNEAEIEADTIDWSAFDTFKLRIDPVYFFQNDQLTYSLASPRSSGLSQNKHFYVRAGKDLLNRDSTYDYSREWAEFILWTPKPYRTDKRVYFMSLSGKDVEKREVRVANIFYGSFRRDESMAEPWISKGYTLLNVDYRGKVGANKKRRIKKYKKEWYNTFMLILSGPNTDLMEGHHINYYEVLAVIDKGYKAGKLHMAVYELDKIFGENFYLIKQ